MGEKMVDTAGQTAGRSNRGLFFFLSFSFLFPPFFFMKYRYKYRHARGSISHSSLTQSQTTGPIPLASYMRMCLTADIGGYYTGAIEEGRDQFGLEGDFVTSPEISQVFGELCGIWFVSEWLSQGRRSKGVELIEVGPGRGTLMDDMLRVSSPEREQAGENPPPPLTLAADHAAIPGHGKQHRRRLHGRGQPRAQGRAEASPLRRRRAPDRVQGRLPQRVQVQLPANRLDRDDQVDPYR